MGDKNSDLDEAQDALSVGPIERVCEQFESATKAGQPPAIEELLSD